MTPEIEPTKPRNIGKAAMMENEQTDCAPMEPAPISQADRVAQIAKEVLERQTAPPITLTAKDEILAIGLGGDDVAATQLLQMADMGTRDREFYKGLLSQIVTIGSHKRAVDAEAANFVLAVVRSIDPRDELEAMLAAQMAAVHCSAMMMARKLNHVNTIQQQDSAERALNKLTRTFATQIDTLKRYRTGGQQKVTVEHVTVNEGGQAIVGAVHTGGGGRK